MMRRVGHTRMLQGVLAAGVFLSGVLVVSANPHRSAYSAAAPPSQHSLRRGSQHNSVDLSVVSAQVTDDTAAAGVVGCDVAFGGEMLSFQSCLTDVGSLGIDVYWNIDEENSQIETLFGGVPDEDGGWIGWGWGSTSMVPNDAAIAYQDADGNAVIGDYELTARSTAGVQIGNQQGFVNSSAEMAEDGRILGLFTRPFADDIVNGPTDAIWGRGPAVDAPDNLQIHSARGGGSIDLSALAGQEVAQANTLREVFRIHGILMATAWIVLAPLGVFSMVFLKKYNPVAFQVHRAVLSLATLLSLIAYITAIREGSRTERGHLGIGSVVLVLSLEQVISGALRPGKDSPRRGLFYLLHAWAGRIAILLSVVNLFLGLSIADAKVSLFVLLIVGEAFWILLFGLCYTLFSKQFPRTEEALEPKDGVPEPNAFA